MSTHTLAAAARIPMRGRGVALSGGALAAFLAVGHTAIVVVTSTVAASPARLTWRIDMAESTLGLMVSALAFSSSPSRPISGVLADRLGRRAQGGTVVNPRLVLLSLIGMA